MDLHPTKIGAALSGQSGIAQLMSDLGAAFSGTAGRPMHMLGGGNPAHVPAVQAVWRARMREMLEDEPAFDRMLANYDGPAGSPSFRAAMAGFLREQCGWDVGSENIAVTNGGQTAFFFLFSLIAGVMPDGRQRKVLLPLVPEYIGYADQGLIEEPFVAVKPVIELGEGHEFKYRIDLAGVERALDEHPIGAICVSRPTNPTGNVLTDEEIDHLAALAAARDIPLLVDNAYGEPFPGAVFTPIRPSWDRGRVMTFSLSKLGLPGTRTGIVLADAPIIERITTMTGVVGLANNNVGQAIVEPLLASGEILRLSREVIRPFYLEKSLRAQQAIAEYFGDHFPYRVHRSEGAFFLWLWFPELPITSRELYQRLKELGVLVVPGEYFFFGLGGEADTWPHRHECLRITFSQSDATVDAAIKIMAGELQRLHA
jgi:valine--pyruvate aminotransferase